MKELTPEDIDKLLDPSALDELIPPPPVHLPVDLTNEIADYILQAYRKILILERNRPTAGVIEELLRSEGYDVTIVADKEEALAQAAGGEFSLLVVSERFTADGILIKDELQAREIQIHLRIIRDYGMAILGQEETLAVAKARESFFDLAQVLTSTLESIRPHWIGRSSEMMELAVRICQLLELQGDEVDGVRASALFHLLPELLPELARMIAGPGDGSDETAGLGVLPVSVLDCIRATPLQYDILGVINHVSERYDGKGYPDGLKEEKIPLGSRILAPISVFLEMTHGRPDRKPVRRINAMEAIQNDSGTAFDPRVVELLMDILREGLLASTGDDNVDAETILVVGGSEQDELLRLRLQDEGYRLTMVPDAKSAVESIEESPPDLIISDVELPGSDGFSLLEHLRNNRTTRGISFAFLSVRDDLETITRGLRLGADDFLIRGSPVDLLFLKLGHLIRRSVRERGLSLQERRGVTGSLRDMGLMEIIQVLSAGSRSAEISIVREDAECRIYLDDGMIVHAELGDESGEEAFYRVLAWTDGDFVVRAATERVERTIHKPNDTLFMTGFHKLDERRRTISA